MSASDHLNPAQFFHGTFETFKPGDVILPAAKAGRRTTWETSDPHKAYATTSPLAAYEYAGGRTDQTPQTERDNEADNIYHVEPVVPHEVTQDAHDPTGYTTTSGWRVIR